MNFNINDTVKTKTGKIGTVVKIQDYDGSYIFGYDDNQSVGVLLREADQLYSDKEIQYAYKEGWWDVVRQTKRSLYVLRHPSELTLLESGVSNNKRLHDNIGKDTIVEVTRADIYNRETMKIWLQSYPDADIPQNYVYTLCLSEPRKTCILEDIIKQNPSFSEEYAKHCLEKLPLITTMTIPSVAIGE